MVERLRGRAAVAQRKRRLERTNGLCEHCRAKGFVRLATVVNHKIPLIHGGSDEDENTENLCRPCDLVETARVFGFRDPHRGVDRTGRPTNPDHPWNRRA